MTPVLAPTRRRAARAARPTPAAVPDARRAHRERCAAQGQDRALYECDCCGNAFRAEVTASVGCPRCSAGQPW